MARRELSIIAGGLQGNNVAANTTIASFVSTPPGRYRMWGSGRHSLADGFKIVGIAGGPYVIPGGAGDTIVMNDFVFDLTATTTINVQLNTATGASDTASALFFLEKINHG